MAVLTGLGGSHIGVAAPMGPLGLVQPVLGTGAVLPPAGKVGSGVAGREPVWLVPCHATPCYATPRCAVPPAGQGAAALDGPRLLRGSWSVVIYFFISLFLLPPLPLLVLMLLWLGC